jgi:hypothetical protein
MKISNHIQNGGALQSQFRKIVSVQNFIFKRLKVIRLVLQLAIFFLMLTNQLSAQGKVYQRFDDEQMNYSRSVLNYFDNGDEIIVFKTSSSIQAMLNIQWTIFKTTAQTRTVTKVAFECPLAQELTEVITYPDNSYIIILSDLQRQFFIFKFSENNELLWNKAMEVQTFSNYYKNAAIDNGYGGLYLMVSDYMFSGIINIDNNGTVVWSKKVKGNAEKSPGFSICRNTNGGVIGTLKNDNYQCVFSLDQYGNEIWSKTFMDSQYRWPKKIISTQDGNFLVVGDINGSLAYYNKISPTGQLVFAKTMVVTDLNFSIIDLKLDSLDNKYALFNTYNYEISVCKIDSADQIINHQLITNTYNINYSSFSTNSSKLGFNTKMFEGNYHLMMEMDENLTIDCMTIPIGGLSIVNDEEMLNSTVLEGISTDNLSVDILPSPTILFPTANEIQIIDYCKFLELEDLNKTIVINIFPNPSSETLTISLPENTSKTECILFNNAGKEVKQFTISSVDNVVNISDLESGIYMMRIKSQIFKVVKN